MSNAELARGQSRYTWVGLRQGEGSKGGSHPEQNEGVVGGQLSHGPCVGEGCPSGLRVTGSCWIREKADSTHTGRGDVQPPLPLGEAVVKGPWSVPW